MKLYRVRQQLVANPIKDVAAEVRRQLDLVAAVGCRSDDERLSIRFSAAAQQRVQQLLMERRVAPGAFVVMHTGATAPSRRYPPESFAEVARRLVEELDCPVVFTGCSAEGDVVERIRAAMGTPSHSIVGELNLEELAALLSMARLLVSNNTGPVHVAAAVGTPVVALFGPTFAELNGPWDRRDIAISRAARCVCHYERTCRLLQPCIDDIGVDEVVAAAEYRVAARG